MARSPEASGDRTTRLRVWLDRLRAGDADARDRLIEAAAARLRILAHDMLSGDRVRHWEETDDVLQDALVGLHKSLANVRPESVRHFLRIAALHIRRAILNMARHYYGPNGMATHHAAPARPTSGTRPSDHLHPVDDSTPSKQAIRAEAWLRVHKAIDRLADDLRETTELLWLHGLGQLEVAGLLGISERTVRRRWQRARLQLADALDDADRDAAHRSNGLDV